MHLLKKRIRAAALLLVSVLLFNIFGYFYINETTKRTTSFEDNVSILSSLEAQSHEVSQAILVLGIHQSFSNEKYRQQQQKLAQLLAKFKRDHRLLQRELAATLPSDNDRLATLKENISSTTAHFETLEEQADSVLADTARSYAENYGFALKVRENEMALQRSSFTAIQLARNQEKIGEERISGMNQALIISLFLALIFIGLMLTAPTIKLTQKSYNTLQQTLEEVKRSEALLRAIMDAHPDPIFILDKDQKYKMVNKAFADAMNRQPEELLGKDDLELGLSPEMILGDDATGVRGLWADNKDVVSTGQIKYLPEAKLRINGNTRIVSLTKVPLKDDHGNTHGLLGFAHELTEQIRLRNQLIEEKIVRQKDIAKATIDVQEKERNEIGKELHDNVNQILTSAKLYFESMTNGNTEKNRAIGIQLLNSAIEEIRKLSRSFVPPSLTDIGLVSSVKDLLEGIKVTQKLAWEFNHLHFREEELDKGLKLTIYRIIQEQTTNILRYAEASKISVELSQQNNHTRLVIADDGKGFDTTLGRKGVGITNMMNRADIYQGKLKIESAPGQGCVLSVDFLSRKVVSANVRPIRD